MRLAWFAPITRANARQVITIRRLLCRVDRLEAEVAKLTRRSERWRRTALELGPKVGPRAMDVLLMQVQHDEIEDLDEVKR